MEWRAGFNSGGGRYHPENQYQWWFVIPIYFQIRPLKASGNCIITASRAIFTQLFDTYKAINSTQYKAGSHTIQS